MDRRESSDCPQAGGYSEGVDDELLPVAVMTVEGGVELVPVAEVEGELVDRRTGAPLELVSIVVVVGLEPLAA